MTATIALSEDHLRVLRVVAKTEGRTVEDLVRLAVEEYLGARSQSRKAIEEAAFGAWGEGEDGLSYQERVRREW